MSCAGLLERPTAVIDSEWIEVIAPPQAIAPSHGGVVLDAIRRAQAELLLGRRAAVEVDTDTFASPDELDDAAIRAFFDEAN